jgi:hypothetical protein
MNQNAPNVGERFAKQFLILSVCAVALGFVTGSWVIGAGGVALAFIVVPYR